MCMFLLIVANVQTTAGSDIIELTTHITGNQLIASNTTSGELILLKHIRKL